MPLTFHQAVFYFFSAVIVIFSIFTVTSRRILRAATFLLFVLLGTAAFYFILNYAFMGALQITLYAGGIVVLIIFSILLTSHVGDKFEPIGRGKMIASLLVSVLGAAFTLYVLLHTDFKPTSTGLPSTSVREIGTALLSYGRDGFVLPFEVVSLLLLAAIVGAVVIARKEPTDNENINNE